MTTTDGIVLAMLLYYGVTGWQRGLLQSLLGPLSFLVCIFAGVAYFNKTHNIMVSFIIGIVGPIVIKFFGWILIHLGRKARGKEESELALATRLLGAGLRLAWGGAMIAITVMLIAVTPIQFLSLGKAKTDVLRSQTYQVVWSLAQKYFPAVTQGFKSSSGSGFSLGQDPASAGVSPYQTLMADPRFQALLSDPQALQLLQEQNFAELEKNAKYQAIIKDPDMVARVKQLKQLPENEALAKSPAYAALMKDERVKELISDPEILRMIQEKNYIQLMSNEKFYRVLSDPVLVQKFFAVQQSLGGQAPVGAVPAAAENE